MAQEINKINLEEESIEVAYAAILTFQRERMKKKKLCGLKETNKFKFSK
jgi:hypothetical protein